MPYQLSMPVCTLSLRPYQHVKPLFVSVDIFNYSRYAEPGPKRRHAVNLQYSLAGVGAEDTLTLYWRDGAFALLQNRAALSPCKVVRSSGPGPCLEIFVHLVNQSSGNRLATRRLVRLRDRGTLLPYQAIKGAGAWWPGITIRRPDLADQAYYTRLVLTAKIREWIARLPANTRVLDIGCGLKPYLPFFHGTGARCFGLDMVKGLFADVHGNASSLPFAAGSWDAVMAVQVLEHLADPAAFARDLLRILKPGGHCFLSFPFVWEFHEFPDDYFRFSYSAVRRLFAPFTLLDYVQDSNTLVTIAELYNGRLARRGRLRRIRLINRLLTWRYKGRSFANQLVFANQMLQLRKPL